MTTKNREKIENVQEYYKILRTRQIQIIEIIKDTSQMLSKIDMQNNHSKFDNVVPPEAEKHLDSGLQLAFSMINALANILDEQMDALNVWERVLQEEKKLLRAEDYRLQDYYEITTN